MRKKSGERVPSKPIVFVTGVYGNAQKSVSQQLMFLRAMNAAEDPKKFKQVIRARAAVDVFRTIDKIALRKEWHSALERNGIDFDLVLRTLKQEMLTGEKGSDRIQAAKTIIKSMGLDKYEDSSISGGSWEDEILKASEATANLPLPGEDYDVKQPHIPDHIKKQRKDQNDLGRSLYDK